MVINNQSNLYSDYRPVYPDKFMKLSSNATLNHNVALDIGCGTGQISLPLSMKYNQVFGIDVSQSQLEIARNKILGKDEYSNIKYSYANSHDLEEFWTQKMNKQKIDLVTFGQSLHWLDHDFLFKSYQKSFMAEGGAMAIFTYVFSQIVDADSIIEIKQAVEQGVVQGSQEVLDLEFESIESHGVEMDKEYTDKDAKADEMLQNFYALIKPHFE